MLSKSRFGLILAGAIVVVGCTSETETAETAEVVAAPVVDEGPAGGPPEAGGMGAGGMGAGGMGGPPGAGGMGAPPAEAPIPDIDPSLVEVYKTVDGVELSAHVFNPEGHSADSSAPALIYFHGGGLRRGSPTGGYEVAERFVPEGMVVISPQYRLLENNAESLDQIVADAKSVVRWTRENADRLGVKPDQIIASGHSAGGYLSMVTGVIPGLDEAGEDASVSSVPNAVVLWSSTPSRRDNAENSMVPEGRTMAEFSAPEVLPDTLPPALFMVGSEDPIASPEVVTAFEARYREAGNQTSFHVIDGADHFFAGEGQKDQAYDLIEEFLVSLGYVGAK